METQTDKIYFSSLPWKVVRLVIRGDIPLLKAWLIYLEMSSEEAAQKSGLAVDTITGMENHDNPLSEDLKKIAQALGMDVDLLVDIDPIKDQPIIYC